MCAHTEHQKSAQLLTIHFITSNIDIKINYRNFSLFIFNKNKKTGYF